MTSTLLSTGARPAVLLAAAVLLGACAGQSPATPATPAQAAPQAAQAAQREARIAAELASTSPIAAGDSLWLDELTWIEVRDRIAAGTTTVIIPTGGIEENGPYLTTGKHNYILRGTCPAIAAKLGNALCAPVVKFVPEGDIDPPTQSMHFPGTISLTEPTYEALLTDIAASLKQAGFTEILLIGDSGGNQTGMANVAAALNGRWAGTGTRVDFIKAYYDPGWDETEKFTKRELGVYETRNDGYHDDIWVTAQMMVEDPEQVRFRQRVDAGLASINGVPITPLDDALELGRRIIEFRAAYTVDAIRAALAEHQED